MLKRALYLCLVTSATLVLLACGGKKDEDALMEDEGAAKRFPLCHSFFRQRGLV